MKILPNDVPPKSFYLTAKNSWLKRYVRKKNVMPVPRQLWNRSWNATLTKMSFWERWEFVSCFCNCNFSTIILFFSLAKRHKSMPLRRYCGWKEYFTFMLLSVVWRNSGKVSKQHFSKYGRCGSPTLSVGGACYKCCHSSEQCALLQFQLIDWIPIDSVKRIQVREQNKHRQ